MRARDVDWRSGRAFSLAYFAGDEVLDLAKNAYARFSSENALNTDAFPSLRRIQGEVVAMTSGLLNGGESAAGFMTSGGTESLLMAVLAARERGRKERGVVAPEMVLPTSAHAAFEKGAHYFGVKSVRVPVRDDFRADVDATAKAINANTVLVVGSAPQYPQGVIDPIEALAGLAEQAGVNCHVDACMGGMMLPFLERLGEPIPRWDFRVPGVTSISVDLHKYGYTAKGASVIVHRSKELRRHQTFVTQNWLGGTYGSSGVLGTKSGGAMAAAWAVMNHLGEDGYLRLTRIARGTALRLADADPRDPGAEIARRAASDARRLHGYGWDRRLRHRSEARLARLGSRRAGTAAELARDRERGARARARRVPDRAARDRVLRGRARDRRTRERVRHRRLIGGRSPRSPTAANLRLAGAIPSGASSPIRGCARAATSKDFLRTR